MKLDRTTRAILSVTALAWSIPFAQAGTSSPKAQVGVPQQLYESVLAAAPVAGVKNVVDGLAIRK